MAKKKAKRKKSSPAPRRRSGRAFAGDIILGIYQIFGGVCLSSVFALLGAIVYGFAPDIKKEVYHRVTDQPTRDWMTNLTPGIGIGFMVLGGLFFFFSLWFAIATCQSRKWAIWLHFVLSLPSAVLTILWGKPNAEFGSGLAIVIAVYCLLRILGAIGPKL